jgi:hypothetical protein
LLAWSLRTHTTQASIKLACALRSKPAKSWRRNLG